MLLLLGTLAANRPGRRTASYQADDPYASPGPGTLRTDRDRPYDDRDQPDRGPDGPYSDQSQPDRGPDGPYSDRGRSTGDREWPSQPGRPWPSEPRAAGGAFAERGLSGPRRRRVRRWAAWAAGAAVVGLIFRRAIASVLLIALSAALHLVGINVHLPSIKFAWPWQTVGASASANTDLGPWVLQKIEGISKPALGRVNFSFFFTHKISKSIGPWPCWYASTFYAEGYASATVNLNPGAAWWAPASGHYRLQVTSRPLNGQPGHVTVMMVLPKPQLPQSVHDVTVDNIPSKPIDTQHSWTYPGFACGVVLRPQFPESVLYSQAQQIAFYRSGHVAQITRPLIRTAEDEAMVTVRDNFVQPTVNALGYTLDSFTIRWAAAPVP
jgi:hypothetical protein